jgi:hypothetical protein
MFSIVRLSRIAIFSFYLGSSARAVWLCYWRENDTAEPWYDQEADYPEAWPARWLSERWQVLRCTNKLISGWFVEHGAGEVRQAENNRLILIPVRAF